MTAAAPTLEVVAPQGQPADREAAYLAHVESEVQWHSREARRARRFHFWLRTLATIGGTGMAVVSATAQLAPWAPALGAAVAVAGQVLDLGQYRERWCEYRRICERLKSELRRYRAGARPYATAAKLDELVDRVEAVLEEGLGQWSARAARVDAPGKAER
jgi:hypothetical protein